MNLHNLRLVLALTLACLFGSTRLHADIIVDLQNPIITPGGITTIDVMIRSNTLGVDEISFFEMEFEITPFAGNQPGTSLRFVDPPSTAYAATGNAANPNNYVFGGILGGDPFLSVDTGATPESLLLVNDFADPDDNAALGTSNQLLTRFAVSHVTPTGSDPSLFASDQYQISVNLPDPAFQTYDALNDEINDFSGAVSVQGGLVSFASTTAVPEPSSFAVLGLGVAAWATRRRRKVKASQLVKAVTLHVSS